MTEIFPEKPAQQMSSFTRFALKQKDGAFGDVAMDIRDDPLIKRSWSFKQLSKHLMENRRPTERVWKILEEIDEIYKKLPKLKKGVWQGEFAGHPYIEN